MKKTYSLLILLLVSIQTKANSTSEFAKTNEVITFKNEKNSICVKKAAAIQCLKKIEKYSAEISAKKMRMIIVCDALGKYKFMLEPQLSGEKIEKKYPGLDDVMSSLNVTSDELGVCFSEQLQKTILEYNPLSELNSCYAENIVKCPIEI